MSEKRSEFLTQDATHQLKTGSKDVRTEMSEKRSEENGFLRPYMASSEMDYFNFDFEIANEKGDWKCKTEKVNLWMSSLQFRFLLRVFIYYKGLYVL